MSDLTWPATLCPQFMTWTVQKAGVAFRSPYAGSIESVTFPGWYWKCSATLAPRDMAHDRHLAEAFFNNLAGGENAVLVYHWLRPVPRGTMAGSPTVNTATVRGDTSIKINTTGTLLAGDLFRIGATTFQCSTDCTPAAGVLTVPIVGRVRVAATVGTAVVWDHPTVRFLMPSYSNSSSYEPGIMHGTAVELEEAP